MDSPKSPPGSVRRHGRNISQPLLRRSTKGPLDDPLAEPASNPVVPSQSELTSPSTPVDPKQSPTPVPDHELAARPKPKADVRFLQDPSLYHSLSTDDVAPPILSSQQQPAPGTPLVNLLKDGHFRRAAYAAAKELLQCSLDDAEQILQLLHTRLACLILLSRPDLAVQEAALLTDLLAQNPPGATEVVPIIPWELRLLLVRLQSLATTDGGRKGIMTLYALASEVRAHIKQAGADGDESEQQVWTERLRDLGLRIADALVEMGELETANRHLDLLTDIDADEIAYRKAVLRLRVGDAAGAQSCVARLKDEKRRATLNALLEMADGQDAGSTWQALVEQHQDDALLANNLAVSMLYAGHITDSRHLLESTLTQSPAFAGLLFNISTVYELCTERAVDQKASLAQILAAKTPEPVSGGWERASFDFKL